MGKKVAESGEKPPCLGFSHDEGSQVAHTLQTFSNSASMHGLSKIREVRYTPLKIIWIMATVICTGFLIYETYYQVDLYYQYNKKTLFSVNYDPITFPDVTLCNHRHIDVDILYSLYSKKAIDQQTTDTEEMSKIIFTKARPDLEGEIIEVLDGYRKTFDKYQNDYSKIISEAFSRTNFWSALNITYKGRNSLAPPLEELVAVCKYTDGACPSNKIEVADSYYRKCLTISSLEKKIMQMGVENGLSVISLVGSGMLPSETILNQEKPIPGLSQNEHPLAGAEGLRVVVHQRKTGPLPLSQGFTIPQGFIGSLDIKVNRYKRMKDPYGNCIESDPYSDHVGVYSIEQCLERCLQNHTVESCGCRSSNIPVDSIYSQNKVSCNDFEPVPENCQDDNPPLHCLSPFTKLKINIKCARIVRNEILKKNKIMKYCGCYPACNEDTYNIGFSLGAWPSLIEANVIWDNVLEPQIKHFMSTLNYSDVKKKLFTDHFTKSNKYKAMQDFVKLNVFLSNGAVQETTEQPDYLFINLMADIGGTMGLWVGMSILSLMEFVQLLLDILIALCKQKKTGRNAGVVSIK